MGPEPLNPFVRAAWQIGLHICRDAIHDGDRCNWIRSNVESTPYHPKTYFHSCSPDFYSGTSGIAFFLAALHSACPDPIIRFTALAAIRQALSRADIFTEKSDHSFFSGKLGVAWAAVRIGEWLSDENMIDQGIRLAVSIAESVVQDSSSSDPGIDIIEGSAGAIPVFIQLYQDHSLEVFKSAALKEGDRLLSSAMQERIGCSWNTAGFHKHNLTGYAHGAAGISAVLLELGHFTSEEKYTNAAIAGIEYENQYFNTEEQNWPDFRTASEPDTPYDTDPDYYSCAWCHGAPGIGLSRLRAYSITGNEAYKLNALAAIATTVNKNTPQQTVNFSLCHGLFGNAELLLTAYSQLSSSDPDRALSLRAEAEKPALTAIHDFLDPGIPLPNGVNNSFDNPEFMTGSAGMGYYFLRLADETKFPSLLLMQGH